MRPFAPGPGPCLGPGGTYGRRHLRGSAFGIFPVEPSEGFCSYGDEPYLGSSTLAADHRGRLAWSLWPDSAMETDGTQGRVQAKADRLRRGKRRENCDAAARAGSGIRWPTLASRTGFSSRRWTCPYLLNQ